MTRTTLSISTPAPQPENAESAVPKECDSCKFFHPPDRDSVTRNGTCRFHAPKVFYDDGVVTAWPKTKGYDWCKEWRRRVK